MKLNIGCGTHKREGYCNIDVNGEHKPDVCVKIESLDYPENSIDEVYASHVIEHLKIWDAKTFIAKTYKWLKPGGKLLLAIPNMKVLGEQLVKGEDEHIIFNWIYGGGTGDMPMDHKWGWTENTLRREVEQYGFRFVGHFPPQLDDSGFVYKGVYLSLNVIFEK